MILTTWNVTIAVLLIFLVTRVQKLFNGIRAAGNLPGYRIPFQPVGFPGVIFKPSWWNLGLEAVWKWKGSFYKRFGNETISVAPFLIGRPAVYTADLEVAKQMLAGSNKSAFRKPDIKKHGPLKYWGTNVLFSEDDVWRKHRRIVSPAFSQKLYELVWSESLGLYNEMLPAEGFEGKNSVELSVKHITSKFAFYIIGRCGFGFPFKWGECTESADGKISFAEAMRFFIENMHMLNIPHMILKFPIPKFKKLNSCIAEIRRFMDKNITEKEVELSSNVELGNDIFSMLVQANQAEENSKLKLNYEELISDVFLMMFAGHETTAHVLSAALAYLANFPDQQEEIVDQIMSVVGTDRDPTFNDFSKLNKVQAAFFEALRIFPPIYFFVREAKEDTALKILRAANSDEYTTIPILKDTQMVVDVVGMYRNPRHFKDPEVFNISRWHNVSNEPDTLPGFGLGPRACIGRKFAITEAVCFLTMALRDWKVEPLLKLGESKDEWFGKVSEGSINVTLGVAEAPIRFVRRL